VSTRPSPRFDAVVIESTRSSSSADAIVIECVIFIKVDVIVIECQRGRHRMRHLHQSRRDRHRSVNAVVNVDAIVIE
jgi:hypothetical protein